MILSLLDFFFFAVRSFYELQKLCSKDFLGVLGFAVTSFALKGFFASLRLCGSKILFFRLRKVINASCDY